MGRNLQILFLRYIHPNKADSFYCFLLFVQSFNCLYLWDQLPNLCGVFTKLNPKQYLIENAYFSTSDSFFILLDRITNGQFFARGQSVFYND